VHRTPRMAARSFAALLLLAFLVCYLQLAAADAQNAPNFMNERKKGKRSVNDRRKAAGARPKEATAGRANGIKSRRRRNRRRDRGRPNGMPDPEEMDKAMEEMHAYFCAGAKKTDVALCRVWYANEEARKEVVKDGKVPQPPQDDKEQPDLKDIGLMHKEWCAVEGNEKKGPCLMWSGSPIKKKFEDEHDSL